MVAAPALLFSQNFQSLLDRMNSLPEDQRQAVADSFISAVNVFPYCDNDTTCNFIYSGDKQSVAVAGDATGWSPSLALQRIAGTTMWYATQNYPSNARLDYKFVLNGSDWILDPKNPNTCMGGFGPNSELRMPLYVYPPEIAYYANISHGTIRDTTFFSSALNNSRNIKIYLPAGYAASQDTFPVILFHDGLDYYTLGNAKNILDYLIANKMIEPVIGIFVPAVNRDPEYAGTQKDKFTSFITGQVMPVLESRYRISTDPHKRAMIGASQGGNIAIYIGMMKPEEFGLIAAQSSNIINSIMTTFQDGPVLDLRFYLDIGLYDIDVLIPLVHQFNSILANKGYSKEYREVPEGHSWGSWKGHMKTALVEFFPYPTAIDNSKSKDRGELRQNRPNPFSHETTIGFTAPIGSPATLKLYDMQGRALAVLFSGKISSVENEVRFTNNSFKRGNYLYTLDVNGISTTRILTITE
jgi:enterochelin esterase-like enzyme